MAQEPKHVGKGLPAERFTDQRDEASLAGVRGLLLINGGGAVALLAFLQAVWDKDKDLVRIVVYGIAILGVGTFIAGLSHFLRYHASYNFQEGNTARFWWFRRGYIACWYVSLLCFLGTISLLSIGTLCQLDA